MEDVGAAGCLWRLSGELCPSPVSTSSVHCTGSDTGMSLGESEAELSFLAIPGFLGFFFLFHCSVFLLDLGNPWAGRAHLSPLPLDQQGKDTEDKQGGLEELPQQPGASLCPQTAGASQGRLWFKSWKDPGGKEGAPGQRGCSFPAQLCPNQSLPAAKFPF